LSKKRKLTYPEMAIKRERANLRKELRRRMKERNPAKPKTKQTKFGGENEE